MEEELEPVRHVEEVLQFEARQVHLREPQAPCGDVESLRHI
jgi:hypothetical protein